MNHFIGFLEGPSSSKAGEKRTGNSPHMGRAGEKAKKPLEGNEVL